jgi:hypothetical protein
LILRRFTATPTINPGAKPQISSQALDGDFRSPLASWFESALNIGGRNAA